MRRKVYVQPELKLGIGDKAVTLQKVTIYRSSTGTDTEELYGNLGQDVVAGFQSFTLDFLGDDVSTGRGVAHGEIEAFDGGGGGEYTAR